MKELTPFLPTLVIKHWHDLIQKPLYLPGTTLFADISGFTTLSEALQALGREGAEILTKHINFYFDGIIRIVRAYHGEVMRFAGDAVTAYFPDEATASHGALEIQSFFARHPEIQNPAGTFSISIKIGIASGKHLLMLVGKKGFQDYCYAGTPVDQSAEAEHHAKAGQVVIKREKSFQVLKPTELLPLRKENPQAPPPWQEDLQGLIPIRLKEKVLSGYESLLNEHRKTTVGFCRFGETFDYENPEDLEVLHRFYTAARRLIEKYAGYLNKIDMGDKGAKLLFSFGALLAHEDDPDRAIAFYQELEREGEKNGLTHPGRHDHGCHFYRDCR